MTGQGRDQAPPRSWFTRPVRPSPSSSPALAVGQTRSNKDLTRHRIEDSGTSVPLEGMPSTDLRPRTTKWCSLLAVAREGRGRGWGGEGGVCTVTYRRRLGDPVLPVHHPPVQRRQPEGLPRGTWTLLVDDLVLVLVATTPRERQRSARRRCFPCPERLGRPFPQWPRPGRRPAAAASLQCPSCVSGRWLSSSEESGRAGSRGGSR